MGLKQLEYRKLREWDEFTSYLYGYVLGDGNLQQSRPRICITSKDVEHAELLASWIGTNVNYSSRGEGIVQYTSSVHYNKMIEWGMCPNKSRVGCHLNVIPTEDNFRHFIRGLMDSDGCFSYTETKNPTWFVEGNISYMENIKLLLEKNGIETNSSEVEKNDNLQLCVYDSLILRNLYKFLYDGSEIYMKRKRLVFDKFMLESESLRRVQVDNKRKYWSVRKEELKEYVKTHTNKQVAEFMGMSYGSTFSLLKQLGLK